MTNRFMYEGSLGRFPVVIEDEDQYKQLQVVISRRINDILIPIEFKGKIEKISSDNLHFIQ